MTLPIITTAVAAVLIILQQALMMNVGFHRAKSGIFLGIGDDRALERKHRRHGNLAENAGIFIATLGLAEITGLSPTIVAWVGSIFVAGRLLHALGFSSELGSHGGEGSKIYLASRALGSFSTATTGLFLGGYLLYTLI